MVVEKLTIQYVTVGQHRVNLVEVRKFDELDPREPCEEQRGEPIKDLVEIPLFEEVPSKTCKIGSALIGQLQDSLIQFLQEYRDVFTWSHDKCKKLWLLDV